MKSLSVLAGKVRRRKLEIPGVLRAWPCMAAGISEKEDPRPAADPPVSGTESGQGYVMQHHRGNEYYRVHQTGDLLTTSLNLLLSLS